MSEAMKSHFLMMARYNAWANARVYRMASQLSDEQYRRDVGAYFKSLHGTLNHLLATDRIWMHRLTGEGILKSSECEWIRRSVVEEVDRGVEWAEQSPYPDPEDCLRGVYHE